jgi:Flp pilus assembly protein TadG
VKVKVKPVQRFISSAQGTVAVVFSVAAMALVLVVGLGVDYVSLVRERAQLQAAADASAVAGAKEISLASSDPAQVTIVAENFARANLGLSTKGSDASKSGGSTDSSTGTSSSNMLSASSADSGDSTDSGSGSGGDGVTVTTTLDDSTSTISVEIEKPWTPYFAGILSGGPSTIKAAASAQLVGSEKICVLALHETTSGAIALSMDARLTANGCGVYSNSTSSTGLASYKNSVIEASLICSAGGVGGGSSNFLPEASTDCPAIPDPLADRQPPPVGLCDHIDLEVLTGTVTLTPGTYCGGLLITGDSVVTFAPGVYVLKDGPFSITQTASVVGEYVGFYLLGDSTKFVFANTASVELSAPNYGPMAGLMFFEDRNAPLGRLHDIVSENARKLVGTIYLSRGVFNVSSKKPVADQSAYTAIVAREIRLNRYPQLVLNTDYDLTDVPVPSGLSGVGGRVVLTK